MVYFFIELLRQWYMFLKNIWYITDFILILSNTNFLLMPFFRLRDFFSDYVILVFVSYLSSVWKVFSPVFQPPVFFLVSFQVEKIFPQLPNFGFSIQFPIILRDFSPWVLNPWFLFSVSYWVRKFFTQIARLSNALH